LYTVGTPNGVKVSILLEELLLAYPDLANSKLSYDFSALSFQNVDQKTVYKWSLAGAVELARDSGR
jgi:glutathione S-transferase